MRTSQMRSRASVVHFGDRIRHQTLCATSHGLQVTLTTEPKLVTCKLCRFHLGEYQPASSVTNATPIMPKTEQLSLFPA